MDAVVLGQAELGVHVLLEQRSGVDLLQQGRVDGLLVLLALIRHDGSLFDDNVITCERDLLSRRFQAPE